MDDLLLQEPDDLGVVVLTWNRPASGNAWTTSLHEAYLAALDELAADTRVRAVVVTGAGRSFCIGTDAEVMAAAGGPSELPVAMRNASSSLRPIHFPKPLIAAVNGAAIGVGFVQALLADVRFASASASFVTAFAQRGLVAEHAAAWLLTQIAGRGVALDLLLSSRRVSAIEAERLRLVHRVVPDADLVNAAVAYARDLARDSSPASMNAIKHQVTSQSAMTLGEAERATRSLIEESLTGPDFAEGVASFLQRRAAQFGPLGEGTEFTLGHVEIGGHLPAN